MKLSKEEYKKMYDKALKNFGKAEYRLFFAPSRINIIGEHIDYNGGKVLPSAIEMGTYALVKKTKRNVIRLKSLNSNYYKEVLIGSEYASERGWVNYPLGVINNIEQRGYEIGGIEGVIYGNIPTGAGLSSSASLELLIGSLINELYNDSKISLKELALIGKDTENNFIGVNSGIMDQFAIAMGKADKAILLDTESLDYEYVDVDLKDKLIVILNTNKGRRLIDSKYNERRAECESALEILKQKYEIKNLCDLDISQLDEAIDYLEDENQRKRLRHVVTENARVYQAVDALKSGDMESLGKLLNESHYSLRYDYEVTGKHLDEITSAARISGALGARMTGAGFGGCGIALVEKDAIEEFKIKTEKLYKESTGIKPGFYVSKIGFGPKELEV
ncbi:MAG: galactokinase [Tissierellia bacterium]|nr:galactokinase [Tissierellia bacterium]